MMNLLYEWDDINDKHSPSSFNFREIEINELKIPANRIWTLLILSEALGSSVAFRACLRKLANIVCVNCDEPTKSDYCNSINLPVFGENFDKILNACRKYFKDHEDLTKPISTSFMSPTSVSHMSQSLSSTKLQRFKQKCVSEDEFSTDVDDEPIAPILNKESQTLVRKLFVKSIELGEARNSLAGESTMEQNFLLPKDIQSAQSFDVNKSHVVSAKFEANISQDDTSSSKFRVHHKYPISNQPELSIDRKTCVTKTNKYPDSTIVPCEEAAENARLRALERVRKAKLGKELDKLVDEREKSIRRERLQSLQKTTSLVRSSTPLRMSQTSVETARPGSTPPKSRVNDSKVFDVEGRQRALSRVRRFKIDSKRKKENEDQVKENKKIEKLKKRDLQISSYLQRQMNVESDPVHESIIVASEDISRNREALSQEASNKTYLARVKQSKRIATRFDFKRVDDNDVFDDSDFFFYR